MRLRSSPPAKSRRAFRSSLKGSLVLEKKNTSVERTRQKTSPPLLSDVAVSALAALEYAAANVDPIVSSIASSSSSSSSSAGLLDEQKVATKKKIPKQIIVANVNDDSPREEFCKPSMEKDTEIEDDEEKEDKCLFCGMSLAGLPEDASDEQFKLDMSRSERSRHLFDRLAGERQLGKHDSVHRSAFALSLNDHACKCDRAQPRRSQTCKM